MGAPVGPSGALWGPMGLTVSNTRFRHPDTYQMHSGMRSNATYQMHAGSDLGPRLPSVESGPRLPSEKSGLVAAAAMVAAAIVAMALEEGMVRTAMMD